MKWEHRCSLEWLKERQQYLTASDVKSLLPITKTGRKRDVGDAEYLKVMSSKMVDLTEEDCLSTGVMARGHLLEPYAISVLNSVLGDMGEGMMYHWDDKVVSVRGRKLAFSPDAMDIPMDGDIADVTAIAEVKSYSADKHLTTAFTPKDQIEERWQIACAMAVLPTIEHAYLVLYNPKMKFRKAFIITYDRSDLEDEIAMILKVEEDWNDFCEHGILTKRPPSGACFSSRGGTEEAIEREIAQRMGLNP